jgi:putative ABC transport system permease protein
MRPLRDLLFRLRALFRPGTMERDLKDEFAFHLEMETRKLLSQGLAPEAAAREARLRFGGQAAERERARGSWGITLLRDFLADLRHAVRQLRRRPAFSFLGILTLALGIGATVGLSGVVRSVLIRPLPVTDEATLRVFYFTQSWRGSEFDYLQERIQGFTRLAAWASTGASLRTDAQSTVLTSGLASAELFEVIGASPLMGRGFVKGEDRPGAEPVVVLSYGLWQQELGGDPGIIGRRIVLDGSPTTVIGVMPRGFYFPSPEFRLWRPLTLDPASGVYRGRGWLSLIGRTRPGLDDAGVQAEMNRLAAALGEQFTYSAAWDKSKNAYAKPLRDELVGNMGPALLLLLGAGVLLLLMACANVAALVLARTTDRTHEMSLRAALGAGRGRLARQIVTESLTFSLLAGGLGLLIATLGFGLLVRSLPLANGLGSTVTLDGTAFLAALLLAVVVGLGVSIAPVRDLLRGRMTGVSNERGSRGLGRATGRVHAALVGGEAAVAVLLIVGAMLLIRSVGRLLAIDLGLDPAQVAVIEVTAYGTDISGADRWRIFRELEARTAALNGVSSVGLTSRVPIRDGGNQGNVEVVSNPGLQGADAPNAFYRPVTPGFLRTLGLEVVKGRGIEPSDRAGARVVGLVSESFAAKAWPGQDPIGQLLRTGVGGDTSAINVVGVVEEAKMQSIAGENPFVLYVPLEQSWGPGQGQALLLKTTRPLEQVVGEVRGVLREIDPRAAIAEVTTMEQVVEGAMAEPLRLRFFLTLFGGLALLLGVVGVYSVVSYSVARRQTEFGVRMALGATPSQVVQQVMGKGLLPVALGTVAGIGGAVLLAKVAARFLYGVTATDPLSIGMAAVALLLSGTLAAMVPAWRAARVSPVESLRSD